MWEWESDWERVVGRKWTRKLSDKSESERCLQSGSLQNVRDEHDECEREKEVKGGGARVDQGYDKSIAG